MTRQFYPGPNGPEVETEETPETTTPPTTEGAPATSDESHD
jgi:hypothetical protein